MQLLQAVLNVLAAAAATGEDGEPVAAGTAELGPTAGAVGSSCWRTLAGRYRGSMGLTDADEVNITAVGPPGSDSAKYVANSYSGFRNLNIVAFANDTISAVPGNNGPTLGAFNATSPPCSAVVFGKPGFGWCREEVCGCGAPTCGCLPGPGCAPARPAPPAGGQKYPGCTACNHPFTYAPYPGPSFVHPLVHHSPDPLHIGGWHDMTGALTHGGRYHTWQGCMEQGGWCHSSSADLVHWQWEDMGVHTVKESWQGFISGDEPCSGFMTVDERGRVCAGFRQCEAGSGTTALNPRAHLWDAPLEIRCTKANATNLSQFGAPEYILPGKKTCFLRHCMYYHFAKTGSGQTCRENSKRDAFPHSLLELRRGSLRSAAAVEGRRWILVPANLRRRLQCHQCEQNRAAWEGGWPTGWLEPLPSGGFLPYVALEDGHARALDSSPRYVHDKHHCFRRRAEPQQSAAGVYHVGLPRWFGGRSCRARLRRDAADYIERADDEGRCLWEERAAEPVLAWSPAQRQHV